MTYGSGCRNPCPNQHNYYNTLVLIVNYKLQVICLVRVEGRCEGKRIGQSRKNGNPVNLRPKRKTRLFKKQTRKGAPREKKESNCCMKPGLSHPPLFLSSATRRESGL